MVLKEYLPLICGRDLVGHLLCHPEERVFRWRSEPFLPVEFSAAAFRFGHSQVRRTYALNQDTVLPAFGSEADAESLRGGRRLLKERRINWRFFFQLPGEFRPERGRAIDTRISRPLLELQLRPGQPRFSLASRNLLRGLSLGLPTDQTVARALGVEPLGREHFDSLRQLDPQLGLESATPLWFYLLKEAEILEEGLRLGPTGGRIVAETLIGLLEGDRFSYLRADPGWQPKYGKEGRFGIADLLAFVAGDEPAEL